MDTAPSLPLFHEEWILDKTQKREWESFLESQGLAHQTVEGILSHYQLASLSFGDPVPAPLPKPSPSLTESPALLWENQAVEVYAPPHPRVRHHLWVVLKRPATFSEVSEDETVQLKGTVNKILTTLQETFSLRAVVAQWNEPQPGQLKRYTIEVIPARMDAEQSLNLWDKVECNNYIVFRGLFPASLPGPSDLEKREDSAFWKETLQKEPTTPFSTLAYGEPIADWILTRSHLSSGAAKILECMERLLHLQGFRLERSSTPQKIPDQECSVLNHGCPFCESSVIDSQTVYETALSRIFYNFKPTIPGAHFLIVPKRHLPTTDRLREDEVRDLHGIAQRLGKVLEEKTGRSDIKMYTQDGPSAGQTVGHTHMHMMLTPQALRHLFFSLNYQNEKPISAEEMRAVVEDIGQRLSLH